MLPGSAIAQPDVPPEMKPAIRQTGDLHEIKALPPAEDDKKKPDKNQAGAAYAATTDDSSEVNESKDKQEARSATTRNTNDTEGSNAGRGTHLSPKLALTLAGGGARGAAHIGVLKVLEREGIKPDFIAGNSAGAVVGSLYAAGVPLEKIEKLFVTGKVKKAFFPIPTAVKSVIWFPKYAFVRLLTPFEPKIGLYSGKSISKLIEKNLPDDIKNIEDLKIPGAFTATNLNDTKTVWMTKGNIAEAVRASCTVPFMYRPVELDGALLIDGGIRANLPADLSKTVGAHVDVAVKLHSYLEKSEYEDYANLTDYADRITSVIMAEVESTEVKFADVLIEPEVHYVSMHTFDKKTIQAAIKAGEEAAEKMLPQIRSKMNLSTTAHAKVETKS